MNEITFSNAWDTLGGAWSVTGIVPGWAHGRVFACPVCWGPAVATDVYIGGRGDVPVVECVGGHVLERDGTTPAVVMAIVKHVILANTTRPWPTGQNVYVTSGMWLAPLDGRICLHRSQHQPREVGLLSRLSGGNPCWRPLPDTVIRQAVMNLEMSICR
ncbi:MAG: hypothetical protein JW850_04570 [Thermoflexales bacterium]|nr:hypothetical protein [Thermoflexales bacterium]